MSPTLVDNGDTIITGSALYKSCPDSVKKQITRKKFTEAEKKEINEVINKYEALLKCDDIPLKTIGRTNKGISKNPDCFAETSTQGEWFRPQGAVVLTDAAAVGNDFKDPKKQFRGTLSHEISHALMNNFDPRSCKEYQNYLKNPLMQEYQKISGWNTTGTNLTETTDNKAPSSYARNNPKEDLAESVMYYLYESETLKSSSRRRFDFVKKLFTA